MQRLKKIFDISTSGKQEVVQPVLSVRVGEKYFSYAVSSNPTRACYALSYWIDDDLSADAIAEVLKDDKALGRFFYQVKICYDYPANSLVPAAGFRQENASLWKLDFPGTDITITENIAGWQMYNVYTVPNDIHHVLAQKFPSAICRHQATVGLQSVKAALPGGYVQVDIRNHEFYVLAFQNSRLLVAQPFEYNNPEDVIYYLLKIFRYFSLSQTDAQVELSGLIERESALFKELYQYFNKLHLREADWKWEQNNYPLHFFTTLNDLAKCAL